MISGFSLRSYFPANAHRAIHGLAVYSFTVLTMALAEEPQTGTTPQSLSQGPWGEVRIVESLISPPADLLEALKTPTEPTRWFVRPPESSDVDSLMASCGIDAGFRKRWMQVTTRDDEEDIWIIQPEREDVIALPSVARESWYDLLTLWPHNLRQRYPFRSSARPGVDWVDLTMFPMEVRPALSNLFYRHENVIKLADMNVIPTLLTNQADLVQFKRMIASKRTLLAALFVKPGDDIDALVAYWGVFGRHERIRSIIELASRSRSPWGIPLELLLPSIPRSLIYTYQQGTSAPFDLDCNWSTYNFFRSEPDYSVNTAQLRRDFLHDNYDVIPAPSQFGDVVAFLDKDNNALHLCNHIVDDIVFTKNGFSTLQPWILMRLEDVESYFESEFQSIQKVYFRYRESP